jgi:hypothetical protein
MYVDSVLHYYGTALLRNAFFTPARANEVTHTARQQRLLYDFANTATRFPVISD